MAKILLRFTYTDPNNVGPWPPSVNSSSWLLDQQTWLQSNEIGLGCILFDNEEEFRNYVNGHRLTDPALRADVTAWKTAHNITHSYEYYTVTDLTVDGLEPLVPL